MLSKLRLIALLTAGALAAAACAGVTWSSRETTAQALTAVLAGDQRTPEERARDVYRHPKETLLFFGLRPEMTAYEGAAKHLQDVWVATRASLRAVLERVTLEDVVKGKLPAPVARLVADPDAWEPRIR